MLLPQGPSRDHSKGINQNHNHLQAHLGSDLLLEGLGSLLDLGQSYQFLAMWASLCGSFLGKRSLRKGEGV